jgi:hypothetical protein
MGSSRGGAMTVRGGWRRGSGDLGASLEAFKTLSGLAFNRLACEGPDAFSCRLLTTATAQLFRRAESAHCTGR